MGAFSWLRAERTTQRKNIAVGDIYKILIGLSLNYKFSAAIQVTQNFQQKRTII